MNLGAFYTHFKYDCKKLFKNICQLNKRDKRICMIILWALNRMFLMGPNKI
jgi:hypothetical protein